MNLRLSRRAPLLSCFVLGNILLAASAGQAAELTGYQIQVLARLGQKTGDFSPVYFIGPGQLNDHGQMAVTASIGGRAALLQFSDGKFTVIALAGGPSPDGKTWPTSMGFSFGPISINDAGSMAFVPIASSGQPLGVYLWPAEMQKVIPVAVKGMSAVNDLVFLSAGEGWNSPAPPLLASINNQGDVAFAGFVKSAAFSRRIGLFVRHADGVIQGAVLPGDPLPGLPADPRYICFPSINDAGQVAFTGHVDPGRNSSSLGFVWQNGAVQPLTQPDSVVPGLGNLLGAITLALDSKNGSALLLTWAQLAPSPGLCLWRDGQLVPVVSPGQEMPGGGMYQGGNIDWGLPNGVGQYPFVCRIQENNVVGTAAYLIDTDGKLSLIAKSGMTTPLGTVAKISSWLTGNGTDGSNGIGLNSQGQVALTARLDKGSDALVLLTPRTP